MYFLQYRKADYQAYRYEVQSTGDMYIQGLDGIFFHSETYLESVRC